MAKDRVVNRKINLKKLFTESQKDKKNGKI